MELRTYQAEALEAVVGAYGQGVQRQLVVIPTGGGKTAVFAALPDALGLGRMDVTLCVAHVEELVGQAAAAFERLGTWVEKEKGDAHAGTMARIVVGSVQSLRGKRLASFFERFGDRVRVLVIDEAHRSAAKTYRDLIAAFFAARPDGLLLGVTATPQRTDRVGLGGIYDQISFTMEVDEAIAEGYLVPIRGYRIQTGIDLSAVRTRGGDYDPLQLAKAVDCVDRTHAVVEAFAQVVERRRAIVFGASVSHAQALAQALSAAGFPTLAVWGAMGAAERVAAIEAYRTGRVQALACRDLLIEGFDVPGVEAVVMARPTQSGVIYRQSIGRALRPHESIAGSLGPAVTREQRLALIAASPKRSAVVLDVCDVSARMSMLCVPSLFGLPAWLDLRGKDPSKVRALFEAASKIDRKGAEQARDIATLQAITRVDLFTVPRMGEEIAGETTMRWIADGAESWYLRLPAQSSALTKRGEVIHDYDARLRDAVVVARRAGRPDPVSDALAELEVDLASVRREHVTVVVSPEDGAFVVRRRTGAEEERLVARRRSRAAAFAAAEQWLLRTYAVARAAVRDNARYSAPVSARQREILAGLGVPVDRIPGTHGEAEALIVHLERRSA